MAKKFLTNLDLTKNQILNVALQNLGTAPSSPVSGQVYFNTVDSRIYFWDGSAWIDISGNIKDIIAGNGLSRSISADGDTYTLDVNVDSATIEINADTLRVKDLGITTAKLNDSAVTTVKINANAVTYAKLQQMSSLTVIGNLSGSTANAGEITVITDLSLASSTTLATANAIKSYVDTQIGGLGNLEGGWDASLGSFPTGSSPVSGTKKGDYWYVTTAGTVNGVSFNVGDVLIATVNSASTTTYASNWLSLEVNRDQATTTVLGLMYLATQTEVNTGTDSNKAVTPATLSGRTATESRTGIAAIATQTQVNTGTDDATIVTPLKLTTLLNNRVGGYAANVGDGTATSFALTHGLATSDVIVSIYDNSTKEEIITDVVVTSSSVVTVSFAVAPSASAYRVVIKK